MNKTNTSLQAPDLVFLRAIPKLGTTQYSPIEQIFPLKPTLLELYAAHYSPERLGAYARDRGILITDKRLQHLIELWLKPAKRGDKLTRPYAQRILNALSLDGDLFKSLTDYSLVVKDPLRTERFPHQIQAVFEDLISLGNDPFGMTLADILKSAKILLRAPAPAPLVPITKFIDAQAQAPAAPASTPEATPVQEVPQEVEADEHESPRRFRPQKASKATKHVLLPRTGKDTVFGKTRKQWDALEAEGKIKIVYVKHHRRGKRLRPSVKIKTALHWLPALPNTPWHKAEAILPEAASTPSLEAPVSVAKTDPLSAPPGYVRLDCSGRVLFNGMSAYFWKKLVRRGLVESKQVKIPHGGRGPAHFLKIEDVDRVLMELNRVESTVSPASHIQIHAREVDSQWGMCYGFWRRAEKRGELTITRVRVPGKTHPEVYISRAEAAAVYMEHQNNPHKGHTGRLRNPSTDNAADPSKAIPESTVSPATHIRIPSQGVDSRWGMSYDFWWRAGKLGKLTITRVWVPGKSQPAAYISIAEAKAVYMEHQNNPYKGRPEIVRKKFRTISTDNAADLSKTTLPGAADLSKAVLPGATIVDDTASVNPTVNETPTKISFWAKTRQLLSHVLKGG